MNGCAPARGHPSRRRALVGADDLAAVVDPERDRPKCAGDVDRGERAVDASGEHEAVRVVQLVVGGDVARDLAAVVEPEHLRDRPAGRGERAERPPSSRYPRVATVAGSSP